MQNKRVLCRVHPVDDFPFAKVSMPPDAWSLSMRDSFGYPGPKGGLLSRKCKLLSFGEAAVMKLAYFKITDHSYMVVTGYGPITER